MNDPEFQKAFEEQNRRDQISYSTLATVLSMILNLLCSVMDYFVYPQHAPLFFKVRVCSVAVVALTWLWFKSPWGRNHHRVFGVMWYASPLAIILWMIYYAGDPYAPYYAGLNIVLLAVGLLSPWTYMQNLVSAALVLVSYVVVCLFMATPQSASSLMNNTTFLVLTAVIVVSGSVANVRQRFRAFELRWELDKSRRFVEDTNRKLVELDQARSRFFANISHELRTPLTLLIAPLESLLTRFRVRLDAETIELLDTMHSNGLRLLKLINDLLDLVKLESGKIEVKIEPVELKELIRGLTSAARQVAENKKLTLLAKLPSEVPILLIDADKLEKILLNLIFNALKFTPEGGTVTVEAKLVRGELLLLVQDNGVGIPAHSLPFIFDRFYQVDGSPKRKFQGTGIGLALVKELVEAQKGSVTVNSKEGVGTTFTVCLPYELAPDTASPRSRAQFRPTLAPEESPDQWLSNLYRRAELFPALVSAESTAKPIERAKGNGRLPTVVVADDEPDMLRFLKNQLARDYDVIEAADGQQAVDRAFQSLPDVILLDMMMPEKDGLQACREIRENAATRSIPIILLTAKADEETKLMALSVGASDFLAKPFSTAELHARIKNLVATGDFQRKLSHQNRRLESTIEQLKDTETQLVQTEKLASLGRLSAGIIHEINNPLNFTTMGVFTLKEKARQLPVDQQQEYFEILHDIEEGIGRVKNIVLDLRTFTHPDIRQVDVVLVSEAVDAALRFSSNEWKDRVAIEQALPPNLVVHANKNKLIQVLVNLLQNSLDALKDKKFTDGQPTILIHGEVGTDTSILKIRDNGPGISPENIDKVFDPFFTTKDIGKGMGLGLSICYRIVHEYGGKISVQSTRGEFCEFTLEFPTKPHA